MGKTKNLHNKVEAEKRLTWEWERDVGWYRHPHTSQFQLVSNWPCLYLVHRKGHIPAHFPAPVHCLITLNLNLEWKLSEATPDHCLYNVHNHTIVYIRIFHLQMWINFIFLVLWQGKCWLSNSIKRALQLDCWQQMIFSFLLVGIEVDRSITANLNVT